ncbi:MAG: hypothetical protein F6K23_01145 [Okeania sp. SIO2C9]|uniref:carboxypeptidase-like regulatory domain-containing protein n=1 Tax=Okeania sp. SIO2C9 TaxID=2607791 RepID=UPI0013C23537|nr:hypothetical protein [Okeania sp. SIO2C9]NEQ71809.1 hypothetical protein [Okeania sp. SIO2C9]
MSKKININLLGQIIFCLTIFLFLTLYFYPAPAKAWSLQESLNPLVAEEMRLERQYQNTPIQIQGRIVGTEDIPLSNIKVRLGDKQTVTNISGEYFFPSIPRQNKLLEIDTPDYYQEIIPLVLTLPLTTSQVEVAPIPLVKRIDSKTRFLFGGDVAMGRRFLDPEKKTPRNKIPPNNRDALIQASHPQDGSAKVLEDLQPLFQPNVSDFRSVNLETPVLDNPKTPHWAKPYSFFTEKFWVCASPFKGIKKENISDFKPPYCRGTDN